MTKTSCYLSSFIIILLISLSLSGCDELLDSVGSAEAPDVDFQKIELTERPTNAKLAAYFCKELASDSDVGGVIDAVGDLFGNDSAPDPCRALGFGPAPSKGQMKFNFVTIFELSNPNSFSIPLIEMLLALDVFKGRNNAELGALCVSFCDPESEECLPSDEACSTDEEDVKSLDDFEPSVEGFLKIAQDVTEAAVEGDFDDNLKFRVIPEADEDGPGLMEARINFELDIDTMIKILKVIAEEVVDDLLDGDTPSFDIPYSALGTLFFDIPGLGRLAIEFGPLEGTWSLD